MSINQRFPRRKLDVENLHVHPSECRWEVNRSEGARVLPDYKSIARMSKLWGWIQPSSVCTAPGHVELLDIGLYEPICFEILTKWSNVCGPFSVQTWRVALLLYACTISASRVYSAQSDILETNPTEKTEKGVGYEKYTFHHIFEIGPWVTNIAPNQFLFYNRDTLRVIYRYHPYCKIINYYAQGVLCPAWPSRSPYTRKLSETSLFDV